MWNYATAWSPVEPASRMRLTIVTGPTIEPLTADEARARTNIGSDVSDEVLNAFITASRQRIDGADGWLGRAINTQTWRGKLDEFPVTYVDGGRIYIPLPPLQSISSISYLDADGLPVAVASGDYQLVMGPRPFIVPTGSSWPAGGATADAITIEFIAGYGDAGSDVPEPIRTAIALGVRHLHTIALRNPTVVQEIEEGIGATRYGVTAEVFNVMDDTIQKLLSTYRVIWL